ncbi:MAG TPA: hypothetical protein VE685_12790 [Thermoanaerobaculia bacterium]|nr:hypothetical protein [Thermoanaerobaculia bacterium]
MARSRRRSPVKGLTTAKSEKKDKTLAHRLERRTVAGIVRCTPDPEVLPHTRELSNPWAMDKDGKMRFDPQEKPELMRK